MVMTNLIPNYLRQIEIASLVLENPDRFSEGDLAHRFNVSLATFRRDAQTLRKLGVGIYSRKRTYRIDNVGLDVLNNLIFDYLSLSQKSKIKNLRLFRNKFKDKTLSTFVTISKCIKTKTELEFYYGDRESEYYRKRIAVPLALTRTLGSFHLVAIEDGDVKNYNLESISSVRDTGKRSKLKSLPDVSGLYQNVWADYRGGEEVEVKLRFKRELEEYISEKFWMDNQKIEYDEKGILLSFKVKLSFDFVAWVMGWGGGVEVLEPEELKREVVKKAKEILGLYTESESE